MGLKKVLGSISPLAGAVTGKGLLGKGMAAFEDATGMGGLFPKMAQAARDKDRRQMAEAEAAQKEADMQAKIRAMSGMKKGGKISAAEAVHKHERKMHKGKPLTKMAKGGSTASKRADGCATKGKTKGRMV